MEVVQTQTDVPAAWQLEAQLATRQKCIGIVSSLYVQLNHSTKQVCTCSKRHTQGKKNPISTTNIKLLRKCWHEHVMDIMSCVCVT